MKKELPIFSHWTEVVAQVLDTAGRFPRNLRPTLGQRIVDRSLEVLEALVAIRYTPEREPHFQRANLALEQLRVLGRIAFERRVLSTSQYERLATGLQSFGRMLGGWRKSVREKTP